MESCLFAGRSPRIVCLHSRAHARGPAHGHGHPVVNCQQQFDESHRPDFRTECRRYGSDQPLSRFQRQRPDRPRRTARAKRAGDRRAGRQIRRRHRPEDSGRHRWRGQRRHHRKVRHSQPGLDGAARRCVCDPGRQPDQCFHSGDSGADHHPAFLSAGRQRSDHQRRLTGAIRRGHAFQPEGKRRIGEWRRG